MSRDIETIRKKAFKLPGGEQFLEEVAGLDVETLEKRISGYQKSLEESEEHKEENTALQNARNELSSLVGPYNDIKKAIKVKTSYLIALIKEKGGE